MALSLLNTNEVQVARLVKALYNAAPGYTFMTNFSGYAAAKGLNGLAEGLVADFAANDNATLAAAVATNVGLTGDALAVATAYLQGQFEYYGAAKRGQVILDAVNGLSNLTTDATYGAAATAFNDTIATSVAYSSNSSNNSTTLATLQAAIVPSGSTIALTSGTDNAAGTAYGDTFTGTMNSTLTDIDRVSGSTGTDTFKITLGSSTTAVVPLAITDVETVRLTGATAGTNNTLNVKYATGLTLLEFNDVTTTGAATHTITGITSPSIPLQVKNATATSTTLNFTHDTAGLTGTADTVALTLTDNGTSSAYVAAVQVNTSGIEGLTVASKGTANYITNLTATSDLKSLTITGEAALNVTTLGGAGSKLVSIDASAATGSVNIDTSFASNIAVTGGAGNDTFVFAGNLDINDTVNGGEGTDTVSVGAADGNAVATNVTLTSIESLTLNAGADQLLSQTNLAAISTVTAVVPAGATTALSGGATGAAKVTVNYVGAASNAALTYAQTTGSGISDSLTVNVGTTSADGIDRGAVTANTIETLTVNSVSKTVTAANTVGISATSATKVVLTGAALTVDSTNFASESTIDASAMTGILTLGSEASTDQTIIGGSANDAITFASADLNTNDSVDGGAGNDTVTIATNGANAVTYGRVALTNVENIAATFDVDDATAAQAHSIDLRNSAVTTVKASLTGASNTNTNTDTVAINNIQASTTKMTVHIIDEDYAGTVTLDSDRNTAGNLVLTATAGEKFDSGTVATTGDWTSFAITQTGSDSTTAHTLAFSAESPLTSLSVAATEQAVTFSSISASKLASLTITGDNAVTVTSLSQSTAALATVDASASSGAITLTATTRTAAATVTTGVGDDSIELTLTTEGGNTIDAGSNTTVADASTGDTLKLNGAATGVTSIDLSVTADQITSINGVVNAATQIGFEHVDASGVTVAGGSVSITGSSGINHITGSSAADTIDGGAGVDVITGGAGNDVITLGTDSTSAGDTYAYTYGSDTIIDFDAGTYSSGGDLITLSITALESLVSVGTADLADGDGSTIADGTTPSISAAISAAADIGDATLKLDNIYQISGSFASAAALEAAIAGGTRTLTSGGLGQGDVLLVLWTDTSSSTRLSAVVMDRAVADGTALATADITITDLITLTGVTSSNLVASNFDFV